MKPWMLKTTTWKTSQVVMTKKYQRMGALGHTWMNCLHTQGERRQRAGGVKSLFTMWGNVGLQEFKDSIFNLKKTQGKKSYVYICEIFLFQLVSLCLHKANKHCLLARDSSMTEVANMCVLTCMYNLF